MNDFEYITTDSRLIELVSDFEKSDSIAVDFEEECNLHAYGEHISIIQIYDRRNFYIIDVLSKDISDKGLKALFTSDVEKIWFECHSDLAILYKKHHIKARNVFDLRVLAKALGDIHGLDSILRTFLGIEREEGKKKNQRENWMKRPIEEGMLTYALKDVEYLFDLKDVLLKEVEKKKLLKQVLHTMKSVTDIKPSKPGWMKICNTSMLSAKERVYLKNIFNARERIAERFNTPAVNVLEKKDVIALAKLSPLSDEEIKEFLKKAPARYRRFLLDGVLKATISSRRECEEKGIK